MPCLGEIRGDTLTSVPWNSRIEGSGAIVIKHSAAIFILAVALAPTIGFSWGPEGHAVVALIAEHYMTEGALAQARDLFNGTTLESVASWADEYRRAHRETAPWHYINIPLADPRIDMARECPHGECVIGKTEQFLAVLRDPKADRPDKAEALKYVIHFVGDMHQPLHCADNHDKGGNDVTVEFFGVRMNLHHLWDSGLLDRLPAEDQLLLTLTQAITPERRAEWSRGSTADWAAESFRAAKSVVYGGLADAPHNGAPQLGEPYLQNAAPLVQLRIEQAGVRLASILNEMP